MASTVLKKVSRWLHRLRRNLRPIELFIFRRLLRDWVYRKFIRNVVCRPTVKHSRRCVALSKWRARTALYDYRAKKRDRLESECLAKLHEVSK